MVRAAYYDRNGLKRGAWSKDEDQRLKAYVERYGHSNWRQLPKAAGLSRCGKSCRLRWVNYLRPNLKHGHYTEEEEETIIKLQQQLGNKWSQIAERLPGRTDNEIKNHWHSHIKKRLERKVEPDDTSEGEKSLYSGSEDPFLVGSPSWNILESSLPMFNVKTSYAGDNSSSFASNMASRLTMNCSKEEDVAVASKEKFEEITNNFWDTPFTVETADSQNNYPIPIYGGDSDQYVLYSYYYDDSELLDQVMRDIPKD